MPRPLDKDLRGIVHPSIAGRHFSLRRWAPDPPLDRFAEQFWMTAWNLPEPFAQPIVTFPVVNLVFQADGSAVVSGVKRHTDQRRLEGTGWALGVMFRVGGFGLFSDRPLRSLVDKRVAASDIFGPAIDAEAEEVVAAVSDDERMLGINRWLVGLAPEGRTAGEEISDLVAAAGSADPPVTTVADRAIRASVSTRTLQRQFRQHVGVGPKLVLERYRAHAAGEAARAPAQSWSDVAERLGYADQAHLTADMTRRFGRPPGAYARAEAAETPDRERQAPPVAPRRG